MISGLIDGLMAVATFAMIFVYSVQLGLVVLAAFLGYATVRLGLYRLLRERSSCDRGQSSGELDGHRNCARDPESETI